MLSRDHRDGAGSTGTKVTSHAGNLPCRRMQHLNTMNCKPHPQQPFPERKQVHEVPLSTTNARMMQMPSIGRSDTAWLF